MLQWCCPYRAILHRADVALKIAAGIYVQKQFYHTTEMIAGQVFQCADFIIGIFRGDLGVSLSSKVPVTDIIAALLAECEGALAQRRAA